MDDLKTTYTRDLLTAGLLGDEASLRKCVMRVINQIPDELEQLTTPKQTKKKKKGK
jgi:hypothetical protein